MLLIPCNRWKPPTIYVFFIGKGIMPFTQILLRWTARLNTPASFIRCHVVNMMFTKSSNDVYSFNLVEIMFDDDHSRVDSTCCHPMLSLAHPGPNGHCIIHEGHPKRQIFAFWMFTKWIARRVIQCINWDMHWIDLHWYPIMARIYCQVHAYIFIFTITLNKALLGTYLWYSHFSFTKCEALNQNQKMNISTTS
jgi:hypothetical protein